LLLFKLDNLQLYSNTLQAIAAGYLISAIALVELPARWHGWLAGALLATYWALLRFVPAPGGAAGDLTPKGNLAMWVDTAVLGRFRDGTDYTWILSSLGFGATTLMGVMAGQLLRGTKSEPHKVFLLATWGLACLLGGWLWSFETPIIKHIWTSSMVLWSGGWCLLLLTLFYWIMDVRGWRRWAFVFTVLGANSIVAYMAPDIINFHQIAHTVLGGAAEHAPAFAGFLFSAGVFGILWLGLYYLYRQRTFVRI
jgi:predicted acyltransferase